MLSRSLRFALVGLAAVFVFAGSAVAEAPQLNTPATVTGAAVVGSQLEAHNGTWLYDSGNSCKSECEMAYQWQRCTADGGSCADISGAGERFYTIQAADAGSRLRAMETMSIYDCGAHNTQTGQIECNWTRRSGPSGMTGVVPGSAPSGGTTPPATPTPPAAPTVPKPLPPLAPAVTAAPAISGLAMVDQTLTATTGTWSGSAPLGVTLEWLRCDANGDGCQGLGVTAASYTVIGVDVGKTLRVKITAANVAGAREAVSQPTSVVTELKPTAENQTIPVSKVVAPHRLVIDQVKAPTRFTRAGIRVSLRVLDSRGFLVEGALVSAATLPATALRAPAEVTTGADGLATLVFRPGAKLRPAIKVVKIVVIARRPDDKLTSPRAAVVRLALVVPPAARR